MKRNHTPETYEFSFSSQNLRMKVRKELEDAGVGHIVTLTGNRLQAVMSSNQALALKGAFSADIECARVRNAVPEQPADLPTHRPPTLAEVLGLDTLARLN